MRFKRSKHNLSNYIPLTFNMGELIPINCLEVLPGDSFRASTSALIRVSPLLAPVMHPVEVRIHHWFVPNRLVWSSWEDFITGGSDGNNADTVPTITNTSAVGTTLSHYLGVPYNASNTTYNALPIRAVNKIFNEFYRDQDLVTERSEDDNSIPKISWEKDYFTAARPWTQKGTEVSLPLGTSAPIASGFTGSSSANFVAVKDAGGTQRVIRSLDTTNTGDAYLGPSTGVSSNANLFADLSAATPASINDLRLAFATQNYQELRARYGSNYVDYLAYLGIKSADARLQRPEYLGGGKQTISFSEVLATAETGTSVDVGDMKGHGIAAVRSNKYTRFFEEHGHVITLASVRPKAIYNDALHRMWSRTDKEDFYQRELELIGQQAIYNKEVKHDHATPDGVFGYGDKYGEYRMNPSRVAGEFTVGEALDHFTMANSYASDPALNSTFVECDPTTRIHASTATDTLWCMFQNHVVARRLVRKNPQPSVL
jgi:hypothetical protein